MKDAMLIQYAKEEGFAVAAVVSTDQIVFDPAFRPYCEENLCGQYNANYSCPPACGTPEEMKQKILAHKKALVLQTVWDIPDYNDFNAVIKAKVSHNNGEIRLAERLRREGISGFTVGASGCALCHPCAIQNGEPCRYPDLRYSCMSAYCIFVQDLAEKCGMDYSWKEGKLSFYGMFVFD